MKRLLQTLLRVKKVVRRNTSAEIPCFVVVSLQIAQLAGVLHSVVGKVVICRDQSVVRVMRAFHEMDMRTIKRCRQA